ncbi:hypothetical protein BD410DRAFT_731070 [Rickenella mellea]|uniref:Integral membrane protein n=1 Tax=Rickenella mellea TaxID=50990 RepID=A0A4Y7PQ80_9AGAM|nr:hypothetical protein BD410DRAFT_731070 [Rickenella mellea]
MTIPILYLLSRGVSASSSTANITTTIPSTCDDVNTCRTLTSLVWSCLATITTCTWLAIHPNVPDRDDPNWLKFLRKFKILIFALIAPEMMVLWAMRQRINARKIANRFQAMGWTETHGYFMLMGGFLLEDEKGCVRTLTADDLENLSLEDKVAFPDITKDEIEDRGKDNAFARVLVLIQTIWFAIQCFARLVHHLPITELELTTLGYVVINLGVRWLWWNKPLDVGCPVTVHIGTIATEDKSTMRHQIIPSNGPPDRKLIPLSLYDALIGFGGFPLTSEATRVPTFYSGSLTASHTAIAGMTSALFGTVFGAIHFIAWMYPFPSSVWQRSWRYCSSGITATTLFFFIVNLGDLVLGLSVATRKDQGFNAIIFIAFCFIFLYRIGLIVAAFVCLKSLPSGALRTVSWNDLIPHV